MSPRIFTTSETAWAAMLAAIIGARESIYLEMYIFDGDTEGYDFLTELEHKARAGVRVFVILDALGSFRLATHAIEKLRAAGAEVHFFSYWLRRTHRKMLIIDRHTVFLGGVNISGKFARWKDLQIAISGPAARVAARSFAHVYRECGGADPSLVYFKKTKLIEKAQAWFYESGIRNRFFRLRRLYQKHINGAKHTIIIVTPYITPHPWLIALLHRAIMRKVAVTIIIPEHTESSTLDRINHYYAHQFEKIGVRVLLGEEMNHAKAMLVDDRVGTIGSHNLDTLSFDWNVEAGIFFEDKEMVAELSRIIADWGAHSTKFDGGNYATKWYDILLVSFLRIFQRTP